GQVPRRSLAVASGMSFAALAVVALTGVGTEPLVLLTTGSFVTVYAIGVASAIRLLPRHTLARASAFAALAAVAALLLMTGRYLIWPAAMTVAALAYLHLKHRTTPPAPTPPEPTEKRLTHS
ncbi:MAG: hypothetical protein ACRDNL_06015, partial [Spirillospora sp.]